MSESVLEILTRILPTLGVVVSIFAMFIFLARGRIQFGQFVFDFERKTNEGVRKRVLEDIASGATPQNALMQEYHAQGLSQSRISFWFSLVFASLGFAIIALSVGIFLQDTPAPGVGWLESAGRPLFALIAGTIIDAVAALFFVQSNKARQLMTEFFDKLRVDRKLDEALLLMKQMQDPTMASRVQGIVALSFCDVGLDKMTLADLLGVTEKPISSSGV
jgi:hypothetical protein